MRTTKKLTLSAITVALGALFISLGSFVEALDLTACCLASLFVMFIYIEIGSPYTWLVWLCTSLVAFVTAPGFAWAEYFFLFGIYPILKAYIERASRTIWLALKALFFAAVVGGAYVVCELLLGVPFFEVDLMWLKIGTVVLIFVAAFAYDIFLTVLIKFYIFKLRPRIKNLLK